MDSENSTGSGPSKVHSMAVSGYTKNSVECYDSGRPYYTDETVDEIIKRTQPVLLEWKANISYDVVELGAGTGKFTRKFYPNLKQPVKYLATDPSESFLNTLQQHCPDVETTISSANCLKLPDNSVRLVVAAQSFHWFATEEVLKEIDRMLVPDGMLVLVWNRADDNIPWIKAAVSHLFSYYPDDVPREISEKWKNVFETFPKFQQQFYTKFEGPVIKGTKSTVIDYFLSISVIASLTDTEREKANNNFKNLINEWFPGITEETALVFPFQTHLYGFVKQ